MDFANIFGSFDLAALIPGIIMGIQTIIIIAAGAGILFYVTFLKKYDIAVEIHSIRSGMDGKKEYKILYDKGALIRDKKRGGAWVFKLLRAKTIIEPPAQHYLRPCPGFFTKNKVYYCQADVDTFYPIQPSHLAYKNTCEKCNGEDRECKECKGKGLIPHEIKFKTEDKDVALWQVTQSHILRETFAQAKTWEKVLPYIIFGVAIMGCILLIYMMLEHMGSVSSALSSTARYCQEMTKTCSKAASGASNQASGVLNW